MSAAAAFGGVGVRSENVGHSFAFLSHHARHKYKENRQNQSNATSLTVYLIHYNQSIKQTRFFLKWLE